jgi:hypothetical protein
MQPTDFFSACATLCAAGAGGAPKAVVTEKKSEKNGDTETIKNILNVRDTGRSPRITPFMAFLCASVVLRRSL